MTLRRESEDLKLLYRNPVFRSDVPARFHWHVAEELTDHALSWKQGNVDAAMYKGEVGRLRLYVLRYGAEVQVRPRPFGDFTLVHMSLRGAAQIESDGVRIDVPEGRAAIVAPRRDIRLRWLQGTEQLILKIPHAVADEVRGLVGPQVHVSPASLIPRRLAWQWTSLVRTSLSMQAPQGVAGVDPQWLANFERTVAHFVLAHQEPGQTDPAPLRLDGLSAEPTGLRVGPELDRLRSLDRFMLENLGQSLALADLAAAAGVSPRLLHDLCLRHRGEPPMRVLRSFRLDSARRMLLARPHGSIAQVALECGFAHLGRFSSYYRDKFGELPRDTAIG